MGYIMVSLAVLAMGFIGWFGTAQLLMKYRKIENHMAFSFGILIFIVSWLVYGLILFFAKVFYPVTILLPMAGLLPFAIKFLKNISKENRVVVYVFLLQFSIGILLQLFLPYYPIGSDWFRHYQASEKYLAGDFATAYGRTPMFNILSAMFLEVLSNHFWVYQASSVFLNSLLIVPLYLIAKDFNKRYAFLTILFVALNSFVLQNTVYTWPRNFSIFFIFFSYYFVIKNRMTLSSFTSAAAFFAHVSTMFSIIPVYIYGYMAKRKNILKSVLLIGILLLPIMVYYAINTGTQESPDTPSSFFLYPFAVNGYESTINRSAGAVFSDFLSKPFYYIVEIRIIDFIMTTTPSLLVLKLVSLFTTIPIIQIQKTVVVSEIPMIYHWLLSFPGALSSIVYAFSLIGLYKMFHKDRKFFWLLVMPMILGLLYWGWIKAGIVNDLLPASVPLLIMVGVSQMKSKKWIYLSLLVMIVEGIIFWYFYINTIPSFIQNIPTRVPPVADATEMLSVDSISRVLFG